MHRTVGIVGCGQIGMCWAGLFLASGRDVLAWDPASESLQRFEAGLDRIVAQAGELGLFPLVPRGKARFSERLGDLSGNVSFIQENAPEALTLKQALFREIEEAAQPGLVIASSTSSLTWSALSAGMRAPQRLISAHPFNPPHLVPLVELFGTDETVLAEADAFYRSLGRVPVRLKKEAAGHIANRLASALWREAVNIVAEGIAGVPEVDAALVNGPGLRWSVVGAHMAYHLGGGPGGIEHYLQHLGPSQERRWSTLGAPSLTPEVCRMLIEGVHAEAAGRPVAELEAERDARLIAALKAR